MIVLTATDGGLMIGLLLGLIFCTIPIWVIIKTAKIAINPKEGQSRRKNVIGSILGLIVLYFVAHVPYTEYNLLYNYVWVEGKLIDRCTSKGSGPSYEFEYYLDGKRYTNCNSSGGKKDVKFPGGVYRVRVSRAMPAIGRIDYEQAVTGK